MVVLTAAAFCGADVGVANMSTIIDFPNLGLTYNGGWCLQATIKMKLLSQCLLAELACGKEEFRCSGAVYLTSNQMLE